MPRRRYKPEPDKKPETVAIIGTGLIGSSIGLAARAGGFAVVGWDPNARALREARRYRAINRSARSLRAAVASADIVVLAAPLGAILLQLPEVFARARPGALVMDVAGVKSQVSATAAKLLAHKRDIRFVAGHPIAGSERSGPRAADAKHLEKRAFALYAPPQSSRTKAYAAAAGFVRKLGAVPLRAAPRNHDRAMAALSALPQLASIALALAAGESRPRIDPRLAGPGYRDATRLAESRFAVWKAVLAANRKYVLRSVRALSKRVNTIKATLQRGDWRALERLFSAAARERRRVKPR